MKKGDYMKLISLCLGLLFVGSCANQRQIRINIPKCEWVKVDETTKVCYCEVFFEQCWVWSSFIREMSRWIPSCKEAINDYCLLAT